MESSNRNRFQIKYSSLYHSLYHSSYIVSIIVYIISRKTGISDDVHPDSMAQELNPNCNCPKTECPRHGDCMACVEAHKAVEGGKIPYCLRFMVKVQGI